VDRYGSEENEFLAARKKKKVGRRKTKIIPNKMLMSGQVW
jgi:hypothetical protein